MRPLLITIPHSGELIPVAANWLSKLSEPVLMRDVDRYVNDLYAPALATLEVPAIIATCHRYVIDLNRHNHEFDAQAVEGAPFPAGVHPKGLHWSVTTLGETLISEPMSMETHQELVLHHYDPFHEKVKSVAHDLKLKDDVFHLDLHSMPSQGTAMHNDPGGVRADVVISDFHGKSARVDFVELIKKAYTDAGFTISYNWPYFGGGITQMYGRPDEKHHTVQVELNRALYMDEVTKKKSARFHETQNKLTIAIRAIVQSLGQIS